MLSCSIFKYIGLPRLLELSGVELFWCYGQVELSGVVRSIDKTLYLKRKKKSMMKRLID